MKKIFVKKGLREIREHWPQYIFLVVILGIGVSTYSVLYDLGDSRRVTLNALFDEAEFMDVQVLTLYGKTINQTTLDSILTEPGISEEIDDIELRLSYEVFLNQSLDEGARTSRGLVIGYQVFDPDGERREFTVNKPLFYVDDPPVFDTRNAKQCYLERKFSKAFDLGKNDEISITKGTQKFELTILEHVNIPEYFFVIEENGFFPNERSLGVVMLSMDTASELYFGNIPDELEFNDLVIRMKNPKNLEEFREAVTREFEENGIAVKTIGKDENPSRNFLYSDLENDEKNTAIFPLMIFGVAALGLVMVLRRMIRVHRTQIGIFKALGVPDRAVIGYFAMIGFFIAVFGLLVSYILSIWLSNSVNSMLDSLYDFAVMERSISWKYYLYGSALSIFLCLVCTIIPTMFALRIKPIDAIQNKEDITTQKSGRLGSRIGKNKRMPVPLKLAVRNFVRRPGRSMISVFGVALSLGLFLGFALLLDSAVLAIDATTADQVWDYEVTMDGFSDVSVTQSWSSEFPDEVESVNPGIMLPSKISRGGNEGTGVIYALHDVESAYRIDFKKGNFGNGKLIISSYFADLLDAGVGDTLSVELPVISATGYTTEFVEIEISGVHTNHLGTTLFMGISNLQELTNLYNMTNVIYVNTIDGESDRNLQNTLITTPGVSAVTFSKDKENIFEQYFDILLGTMALMLLLSVVMAGAIVYNLFMINAQESRRDYATMKTLGTSSRKLSYLIFIEAVFIIILGTMAGIIVGYAMAYGMLANLDGFEVFNFKVVFSWAWFSLGTTMIILVILFVSWRTLRYVEKINIADVIRERST